MLRTKLLRCRRTDARSVAIFRPSAVHASLREAAAESLSEQQFVPSTTTYEDVFGRNRSAALPTGSGPSRITPTSLAPEAVWNGSAER